MGQNGLQPILKFYLEQNHAYYLCIIYGCFWATMTETSNFNKNHMAPSLKYLLLDSLQKKFGSLCSRS